MPKIMPTTKILIGVAFIFAGLALGRMNQQSSYNIYGGIALLFIGYWVGIKGNFELPKRSIKGGNLVLPVVFLIISFLLLLFFNTVFLK